MIECECGKRMKEGESEFKDFKIKGWKCECGEELLDPAQVNVILKLRKAVKQGLSATVGKVGNNLVVRIPKVIEAAYHFKEGEKVALAPEAKGLLIEAPKA